MWRYGSRLDDIYGREKSTILHMFCSQGSMKSMQQAFEACPEQAKNTMNIRDAHGYTPLHKFGLTLEASKTK